MADQPTLVVLDSSVLINLLHAGCLGFFALGRSLRALVPDEVVEEVRRPEQQKALAAAIEAGHVERRSITEPEALEDLADLRRTFGKGEAASLALAGRERLRIACDEQGAFRRVAVQRLGEPLLTTADLLLIWLREELLTVEDADAIKQVLEQHRFRMPFKSFSDLINDQPPRGPDDPR